MSKVATNEALLKALGIDQPLITAVQINMQPEKLPVVTIDRLIDSDAMLHEVSHFDLVLREEADPAPAPAPAFDLDAMCTAARQRVAETVALSTGYALGQQFAESRQIRMRLGKACERYSAEAKQAIERIAFDKYIKDLVRDMKATGVFSGLAGLSALGGVTSPGLAKAMADWPRFNSIGFDFGRDNK
ncbi:hypothetical protein D3C71_1234910 [compost metagenome]